MADAFLAIDAALTERGLRHYEVSNYARPGEEARHNLAYWRGDEYLGLGCAAYGFVRDRFPGPETAVRGVRWRNIAQPNQYVASTRSARPGRIGVGDGISESSERLDAESLLRERIMLGLRVHDGLDVAAAARELGVHGWTVERERTASWLQARQRLIRDGARIPHPPKRVAMNRRYERETLLNSGPKLAPPVDLSGRSTNPSRGGGIRAHPRSVHLRTIGRCG